MKYKWLLFDADGTLFDYDHAEAVALKETFETLDIPFNPEFLTIYREINAKIWKAFELGQITQKEIKTTRFQQLLDKVGNLTSSLEFSNTYLSKLGEGAYLIKGADELLPLLHGKVKMLIITNGLQKVQRSRLAHSTISKYFENVIISEEVGSAKPDSGIFDITFEKMGNPQKAEVLIIGDSLTSDMAGGFQYGIDTCWYNPEGTKLDGNSSLKLTYEITCLTEILEIIT